MSELKKYAESGSYAQFLTELQVWFAELEDAAIRKDKEFDTMQKALRQIGLLAEAHAEHKLSRQVEAIALLAALHRDTDYTPMLESLHRTIRELYETLPA